MSDAVLSAGPSRSAADGFMCRLLRVPPAPVAVSERSTQRLFSGSILLSALRCLLTYIILPLLAPLVGAATKVGADVGLPLGIVALVFDVRGVRRFWLAGHRQRWLMTAVYAAVMGLVLALVIGDIVDLIR